MRDVVHLLSIPLTILAIAGVGALPLWIWLYEDSLPQRYSSKFTSAYMDTRDRKYFKERTGRADQLFGSYIYATDMPRLTFENFKAFLDLNPESWQLLEFFVIKDKNPRMVYTFNKREWLKYARYKKNTEKEKLKKEFAELKQYEEEREIRIRKEKERNACESLRLLINAVNDDINKTRDMSDKEIEEAEQTTKSIITGWCNYGSDKSI